MIKVAFICVHNSCRSQIASVTFARLEQVKIITDKLQDKKYLKKADIKEVM